MTESISFYQELLRQEPHRFEEVFLIATQSAIAQDAATAVALFDVVLAVTPEHFRAWGNRGNALDDLGRFDEAIDSWARALKIRPDYVPALVCGLNRVGYILCFGLGQHQEAINCYQRSLALKPDQSFAHQNIAFSFLALGRYEEGWQAYDYGIRNEKDYLGWMDLPQPRWRGEPIAGKRVILWSEQGFGDVFQFCRYAHLVRDLGATVFLLVSPKVERLFQTVFAQENITIVLGSAQAEPFDFHCPLMSLPLVCGTNSVAKIPATIPYLLADAQESQAWQNRLANAFGTKKRRIGLVWAGGHTLDAQAIGPQRSLHLCQFAPLGTIEFAKNLQFFSLQIDAPAQQLAQMQSEGWKGPDIIDLTQALHDWADTAAFIDNLDLVISCCTAVGHLAAAMGKPTWILLRHNSCWRWLENRDDSPWYPTVRLFRQTKAGDWTDVVNRVVLALNDLADEVR